MGKGCLMVMLGVILLAIGILLATQAGRDMAGGNERNRTKPIGTITIKIGGD